MSPACAGQTFTKLRMSIPEDGIQLPECVMRHCKCMTRQGNIRKRKHNSLTLSLFTQLWDFVSVPASVKPGLFLQVWDCLCSCRCDTLSLFLQVWDCLCSCRCETVFAPTGVTLCLCSYRCETVFVPTGVTLCLGSYRCETRSLFLQVWDSVSVPTGVRLCSHRCETNSLCPERHVIHGHVPTGRKKTQVFVPTGVTSTCLPAAHLRAQSVIPRLQLWELARAILKLALHGHPLTALAVKRHLQQQNRQLLLQPGKFDSDRHCNSKTDNYFYNLKSLILSKQTLQQQNRQLLLQPGKFDSNRHCNSKTDNCFYNLESLTLTDSATAKQTIATQ